MIHEIATIAIKEGATSRFEAGFSEAIPLFKRAKGCQTLRLERSIEEPLRYWVFIGWATMDDHVVNFRGSTDYDRWRELVGDCFASAASTDHTVVISEGF